MRTRWWVGLTAAAVTQLLWLRRLGERGGATDVESRATLPGDEVIPHPAVQTTHAVTINARPEVIWPWLVQMGYYRAGWYTDPAWWDRPIDRYLRWLARREAERSGAGHRDWPSAERIMPQYQDLRAGDTVLDGPPGTAFFTVTTLAPARALVLHSTTHLGYVLPSALQRTPAGLHGAFTWAFVLDREDGDATRLILRTRAVAGPRAWAVFLPVVWLMDYFTTRRLLHGIKRRAEGTAAGEADVPGRAAS